MEAHMTIIAVINAVALGLMLCDVLLKLAGRPL